MLRRYGLITPIITIPGDMSSAQGGIIQGATNGVAMPQIEWLEKLPEKKIRGEKFCDEKIERENFLREILAEKKREEKNSRRKISKTKKQKTKFEKTGKPKFRLRRSAGRQRSRPLPKNLLKKFT